MITTLVAASVLSIAGQAQFWQRHCDANVVCGLPNAISERFTVNGEISEPAASGQLGYFKQNLSASDTGGPVAVTLEVFWKGQDQQGVPYIAAQTSVRQVADDGRVAPIAQCNGFHDVPSNGVFFPVGVCGGYLPNADGTFEQWGVTFYK